MQRKNYANFGIRGKTPSGSSGNSGLKITAYAVAALVFASDTILVNTKNPFPSAVNILLYILFFVCVFFLEKNSTSIGGRAANRLELGLWLLYITLSALSGGGASPLKWAVIMLPVAAALRGDLTSCLIMALGAPLAFIRYILTAPAADIFVYPAALAFSLTLFFIHRGKETAQNIDKAPFGRVETQKEGKHFRLAIYGLLESFLKLYRSVLNPVSIILFLKDDGDGESFSVTLSASADTAEVNNNYSFRLQEGAIGAALNKRSFYTFSTSGAAMPYYKKKRAVASVAVMPVILDRLIGAVVADFDRDIENEKDAVKERLAKLAGEIVSVMEIYDINYKVITKEQRVSLMYDISRKVDTQEGKSGLIRNFLEEIKQFDIFSGYLAEYDPADNSFTVTETMNYPASAAATKFYAKESEFIKYMMDTGKRMVIGDAAKKEIPLNIRRANIDTTFLHLLKSGDTIHGFIKLDKEKPNIFTEFELETLELMLSRITVMLENAKLYEKIKNQAYHDGLTGLLNHLTFQQKLQASVEKKEKGILTSVALCIIDIDFFKKFNDSFGHQEGDRVLKKLAGMLSEFEAKTPDSYCARYGGEEFVFVLENRDIYAAGKIAEQIRKYSTENLKGGNEKEMRPINLSIGVTTYPEFARDPRELFKNADEALYLAKEEGRNTVRTTLDVRKIDRRRK